jgi:hypothetical protein
MVFVAAFAMLFLGLVGCSKKEPKPQTPPAAQQKQGAPVTFQDVKKETGEAAQTTGQYVAQEKDKLVASASQKISELEKELKDLEASAAKGEPAKSDYEKIKPELERQLAAAKVKLEEAKKAGAQAWEGTKQGLNSALTGLEDAYKGAKAKIAPQAQPEPQPPAPAQPASGTN